MLNKLSQSMDNFSLKRTIVVILIIVASFLLLYESPVGLQLGLRNKRNYFECKQDPYYFDMRAHSVERYPECPGEAYPYYRYVE